MGEFKKRILGFAKSEADDVDELLEMVELAKKEFVWRHIVNDLIEGKGYWSEYDIKVVAKWFRKWFGDDET